MCENCGHQKATKSALLMQAYAAKQSGDMPTMLICYREARAAQESYWRCCGRRVA